MLGVRQACSFNVYGSMGRLAELTSACSQPAIWATAHLFPPLTACCMQPEGHVRQ